jgi:hypothetical protein
MAEGIKDFFLGMPIGLYVILILAFGLLCVSFALPPAGAIAPSALQGAALILGATWLFYVTANIPTILANGAKISAKYGNAEIQIGRHRKKHFEEETETEVEEPVKEEEVDG